HVTLTAPAHVRLHGKGDKWRTCSLWADTARILRRLLDQRPTADQTAPVFATAAGRPLTRFGIYKRVRHLGACLESTNARSSTRHITPYVFGHSCGVHLLEAGVELNVIRGWLGHVRLDTTHRHAEITMRMKEAALKLCEPPAAANSGPRKQAWRDDPSLLAWLTSL
ncbi:MAG: tyrosine-type recombinase/integrase, partial [Vicinamibacteraceae bacterium]